MFMEGRTDSEWEALIHEKASGIESNLATGSLASILSPSDYRFPQALDHTLLKPDATPSQIDTLCAEAIKFGFKSCCVNGIYVKQVAARLKGSKTLACSVVGFPLGAGSAEAKAFEARQAIQDGAREIDTVLPLGLLLSNPPQYRSLFDHLKTIITAAAPVPVKVILETSLIPTRLLKVAASVISAEAGASFVKTSTGFAGGGATKDDVSLMYNAVKYKGYVKVKASGGIRSFEDCQEMFKAGAERIGTSSSVALMQHSGAVTDDRY